MSGFRLVGKARASRAIAAWRDIILEYSVLRRRTLQRMGGIRSSSLPCRIDVDASGSYRSNRYSASHTFA